MLSHSATRFSARILSLLYLIASFVLLVVNRICTRTLQSPRILSSGFSQNLYFCSLHFQWLFKFLEKRLIWLKKVGSIKKLLISKAENFFKSNFDLINQIWGIYINLHMYTYIYIYYIYIYIIYIYLCVYIYIYIYTSIPLRPTFYNYFSGEYRQTDKQSAQILRKQDERNI